MADMSAAEFIRIYNRELVHLNDIVNEYKLFGKRFNEMIQKYNQLSRSTTQNTNGNDDHDNEDEKTPTFIRTVVSHENDSFTRKLNELNCENDLNGSLFPCVYESNQAEASIDVNDIITSDDTFNSAEGDNQHTDDEVKDKKRKLNKSNTMEESSKTTKKSRQSERVKLKKLQIARQTPMVKRLRSRRVVKTPAAPKDKTYLRMLNKKRLESVKKSKKKLKRVAAMSEKVKLAETATVSVQGGKKRGRKKKMMPFNDTTNMNDGFDFLRKQKVFVQLDRLPDSIVAEAHNGHFTPKLLNKLKRMSARAEKQSKSKCNTSETRRSKRISTRIRVTKSPPIIILDQASNTNASDNEDDHDNRDVNQISSNSLMINIEVVSNQSVNNTSSIQRVYTPNLNERTVNKSQSSFVNYLVTPLQPQKLKDENNYDVSELEDLMDDDDDDEDDEDGQEIDENFYKSSNRKPKKPIPNWAKESNIQNSMSKQTMSQISCSKIFQSCHFSSQPLDLRTLFNSKRKINYKYDEGEQFDKSTLNATHNMEPSFMRIRNQYK